MKTLTLSLVLLMVALLLMTRHCNIKDGRGGTENDKKQVAPYMPKVPKDIRLVRDWLVERPCLQALRDSYDKKGTGRTSKDCTITDGGAEG